VSSIPQHTQLQRDALAQADCIRVFEEKVSSRAKDRPGLLKALDYLRAGDTPVRVET
jgi:DNA invertase Pin-like site-specific DNA recombinase